MKLINDTQRLISATRNGYSIPVYDDGYGKLYIHRYSMGISGIVRAQTWEDAYSICEDEFFQEASETIEELRQEYNFKRDHVKIVLDLATGIERPVTVGDYDDSKLSERVRFVRWKTVETPCEDENGWAENELFQEAFGFRPNGPNQKDTLKHGIYAKDLNGDWLDELTPELAERLEITLTVEDED